MPFPPLHQSSRRLRKTSAAAGGPFSPTDVAGLTAWLKADAGAYNDAGVTLATDTQTVRQWNDQSGNGNHVTQATSGKRPVFRASILNGLPVVRFDGTDDSMQSGAFGSALSQPTTIFVVGASPSVAANQTFIDGRSAATHLIRKHIGLSGWDAYAGNDLSGGTLDASFHVFQVLFNGGSSVIRVDGGSGVASGNAGTSGMDGLTVGSWGDGTTNPLTGDVQEILVYSGNLSLADINSIGDYIAARTGLAWSTAT